MALDLSLTHSTIINSFIKLVLNILLLRIALLSIGFVLSALCAHVWQMKGLHFYWLPVAPNSPLKKEKMADGSPRGHCVCHPRFNGTDFCGEGTGHFGSSGE